MTTKKHMSEVPMIQRVAAYLAILVGYFFYCYNFVIIDYVRPYIVEAYEGISLSDTAQFYTWQSVGALIGALSCAWFAGRFGKKYTLITITALNGGATIVNMMFTDYATWAAMRFIIGLSLGGYFTVAVSNDWPLYPNGSRQTDRICLIHVLCSFNGNGGIRGLYL